MSELPVLGSAFSPNIEEIVALEPDLVLVDESSELAATLRSTSALPSMRGLPRPMTQVFEKVYDAG